MSIRRFLLKNKTIIELLLTIVEAIVLGVYLSIVADNIIQGSDWIHASYQTKGSLGYLAIAFVAYAFQIYITVIASAETTKGKKQIINAILKVACKSLVYPHKYHIRAIITECDYKRNVRKTTYGYNIGISPERFAEYALDFGITGKAFAAKRPIAEALPDDHMSTYDEKYQQIVDPRLKCVLAAPIFKSDDDNTVIGILAFDSNEPISRMKFDTDSSKELAQGWADIISNIIRNYV
jgi:hypothetical protein